MKQGGGGRPHTGGYNDGKVPINGTNMHLTHDHTPFTHTPTGHNAAGTIRNERRHCLGARRLLLPVSVASLLLHPTNASSSWPPPSPLPVILERPHTHSMYHLHTHRPTTMLRSSCTLGRRLLIRTTQQQQQQRQRMSLRAASSLLNPPNPLAAGSLPSSHAVPQQLQQHQYQQQYQYHQRRAFSSIPTPPAAESHEFQAETRQLLDIVIHSVYTDKEVRLGVFPSSFHPKCQSLLLFLLPSFFFSPLSSRSFSESSSPMPPTRSKSSGTSKVCLFIHHYSLLPLPSLNLLFNLPLFTPNEFSILLISFFPPVSGEAAIADPSLPLEITITTDEEKGTLTLRDTGKRGGRDRRIEGGKARGKGQVHRRAECGTRYIVAISHPSLPSSLPPSVLPLFNQAWA